MQAEIQIPWFRRVKRWGQINITLDNAGNFDIAWWRTYWKKTHTQGIVLNAGGIYAYYPTRVPLHYKAPLLGDKDLFGDLCKAAHEDGLVVFARMDSGRVNKDFYKAHPDWFAVDAEGNPFIRDGLYTTCINGPYYSKHVPAILTEIVTLYRPEGVTDNSWEGLGRGTPCYCGNCRQQFRERTGKDIPVSADWDDPVYLEWISWNYSRRLEQWDLNNRVTKAAGGPDCTWSGMISSSVSGQTRGFCNLKEICSRADIIMIDAQSRSNSAGFQQNADTGKRIHSLVGWDKVVAESMAIYGPRIASKPAPEAHMWMIEGFAGGIAPWWHTVSGYHEDRRRYKTVEPINTWHRDNEQYLFNRTPVATVGVVWSEENTNFYGRNDSSVLVDLPSLGISQALVRSRIPYFPVSADHIDREAEQLSLLILPNIGVLTDEQISAVRRFVDKGGNILATGETSLYDKIGRRKTDYALADLFGVHYVEGDPRSWLNQFYHTYLRLTPELHGKVDGPNNGSEPTSIGERHSVLKGFEETDIFPFGGLLVPSNTDPAARVLMTFIPEFPTGPPEDAWMRVKKTDIPGLIVNTLPNGSRITFMPADLDRQFARYNLPDHGNLLENLIRWTSRDNIPLVIEGAGLIDCNLYRQSERLILHITNLISSGTWRGPIDEYIPIGPISVSVKLPQDVKGTNLLLLVSGQETSAISKDGWSRFKIKSILNHEVVVIS